MTITFNTKGYDGFIDFIKAYAILCVLFGHTFLWLGQVGYTIWAGGQVPLFILIQVFHHYKKGNPSVDFKKVFRRVMGPFILLELITFCVGLMVGKGDVNELLLKMWKSGGYGPGSYFPWIYLQVALLLPIVGGGFCRLGKIGSLVFFLIISEGFEILFSITDFPDWAYRLLAVRYLFLFYLGYLWVKDGIRINRWTVLLSVISLIALVYFEYFSVNDEPWFYCTKQLTHRWPCYFYRAFGFTAVIYLVYRRICNNKVIMRCVKALATSSYEIFLLQMSLIWLFHFTDITWLQNNMMKYFVWLVIVWMVSIAGGIMLNTVLNRSLLTQRQNESVGTDKK